MLSTFSPQGRDPLNRPVSAPFEAADGSLYIPSPTEEDAGVYICTATSAVGYTSREMHLIVNSEESHIDKRQFYSKANEYLTLFFLQLLNPIGKPRIVGADASQVTVKMAAEVGSEVILPCEVQGSPTPLVTWSRGGQTIPPVTAW